jgi:hypothetical protein
MVKPGKFLTIEYRTKSNDFYLNENEFFMKSLNCLMGYGDDLISVERLLSEISAEEMPRPGGNRLADIGLPDPKWIDIWSKNQAALVFDILRNGKQPKP